MSQRLNKLFEKSDPLSREEAKSYLDDPENPAFKHSLEEKMAADEFSLEAMEGFEENPGSFAALSELQNPWKTSESSFTGNSNSVYKSLFWFSAVVAVVACTGIVFLLSDPAPADTTPSPVVQNNSTTGDATTKENEAVILKEIENAQPISKNEQITYEKTVKEQPKTVIEEKPVHLPQPETPNPKPETNHPNPETITPKEEPRLTGKPVNTVVHSNVKFTYLRDLKVVDYSDLYTSNIKKTEVVLTGTPANLEDNSKKDETQPEIRTVYIPYEKYLEETLEEFSGNYYKNALKNFRIILDHYPEDLNAFFYSGLCYYNLGKFDKAIEHFDKCIHNSFSTFDEEAEWYKALSLIKKKKYSDAKILLTIISERKGHYSKKAGEKLKELF